MNSIRIHIHDILLSLSTAESIISPAISRHHEQVAYLAVRLAEEMGFSQQDREDIFLAGLVHDIGALSLKERLEIIEEEPVNANSHAFRSARLFEGFGPMKTAAGIIRYHHLPWNRGRGAHFGEEAVPKASHILHLADRTCIRLDPGRSTLSQVQEVLRAIEDQTETMFVPEQVEALRALAGRDFIWLDIMSRSPVNKLPEDHIHISVQGTEDLIDLAVVFSHIIDFRSRFTSRHSAGVAKTAERLAEIVGFSPNECKMMLVAGYLHDLGKIAIDNRILDKPGRLDREELGTMRSHTYYTYHLLRMIPQFGEINAWAAFHHERLDGTGYPFHLRGEEMSLGSRIMAVADVFTAISEDRPYRRGMDAELTVGVLRGMVSSGALDSGVTEQLISHFEEINSLREVSQREAGEYYEQFLRI